MIKRLYKEFQIIELPFFVVILCAPLTSLVTDDCELRQKITAVIWLLCCAIMGAAIFGQEFERRAMEKLLAQPMSRIRLWREKTLVLASCAGFALFIHLINPGYYFPRKLIFVTILNLPDKYYWEPIKESLLNFVAPVLSGCFALLFAGVFLSLYIRKSHTAFWGALTSTVFIMILWQFIISTGISISGMQAILYCDGFRTYNNTINMTLPLLLWGATSYILGRRKFLSLEV